MGPGEEARQPRSPRLTPLSLRDGAGGRRVCVPSRLFAFQKLSEPGVNGRQNGPSQQRWGLFSMGLSTNVVTGGAAGGGGRSFQSPDDGSLLGAILWGGGRQASSCQWEMGYSVGVLSPLSPLRNI